MLRALRDEVKGLIEATEDGSRALADLELKARPYTLNPNGSLSFVSRPRTRMANDISSACDRPGHGLPSEKHAQARARGGANGGTRSAPSLPSLSAGVTATTEIPSSCSGVFGTAPTNRWEAVQLAERLESRLRSAGGSFDGRLAAMEETFDELTRQVGVHCAERGHLLAKLRSFYSGYASAFGSVTRKRQAEAGLPDLDAQLEAVVTGQRRLAARAAKLEARLKALEQVLRTGDTAAARMLVAAQSGSDGALALGVSDMAASALAKTLASATTAARADVLRGLVAKWSRPDREAALALLVSQHLPAEEQGAVLHAALSELLPAARLKAVGALVSPFTPSEQLELVSSIAQSLQTQELVSLLRLPLSRLPKEKTLEVMEMLLQMSPAIATSFARMYGRMTENQQLQTLHLLCAKMGQQEVWQLKSDLQLESAAQLSRVEAELAQAKAEAADLAERVAAAAAAGAVGTCTSRPSAASAIVVGSQGDRSTKPPSQVRPARAGSGLNFDVTGCGIGSADGGAGGHSGFTDFR